MIKMKMMIIQISKKIQIKRAIILIKRMKRKRKTMNISIFGLKIVLIILKVYIMNTIINYLKKQLNYF